MTSKPSAAAARRLAASYATPTTTKSVAPPVLVHLLEGYVPEGIDDATWAAIRPFHRDVLARSELRGEVSFKKHRAVVANYLAWREDRGLALDANSAMTYRAIDAYYQHGMASLDPKTRNDYRSRLRALATKVNTGADAPARAASLGRQAIKPPYTPHEEAVIARFALRQRHAGTRRQLCAAVGIAGGAGGDSVDLRPLCRKHIEVSDNGIAVHFSGPRPRTVIVRRDYERLVFAGIEGLKPHQLLLGRELGRRNIVGGIVERADLEGAPHIEASRLRSTWLAWLATRPVPLNVILDAAGLKSARTLCDLLPYLPAVDPASILRDGIVP